MPASTATLRLSVIGGRQRSSGSSDTRSRTRSRRGCRTRRSRRSGSTGPTCALDVEPERLEEAVRGLGALGFAGANVTIPHKQAVVALCDEVDGGAQSVNTLVFRDGACSGSAPTGGARRRAGASAPCVIGAGGAAQPAIAALEPRGATRRCLRAQGEWPPDAEGATLVVNATPVRDEAARRARARARRVVDLAYRATAARRARGRRARRRLRASSTGSRCSCARARRLRAVDGRAGAARRDARRRTLCRRDASRLATAGESHGPALVAIVTGLPAGLVARPRRDRRRPAPAPAGLRPQPAAAASSRTRSRCSPACGTGARSGRRSRSSSATATTRTGRGG